MASKENTRLRPLHQTAMRADYVRKWRDANHDKLMEYRRKYEITHAEERGGRYRRYIERHPLYNTWREILLRTGVRKGCTNPRTIKNYIDRGISVCEEWKVFKNFEAWAIANGWVRGLQIDRIDNDGNYEPNNCRFVTRTENVRNRRNTIHVVFNGTLMPLAEAFEKSGCKLSYHLVVQRITQWKWPIEKALTLPARKVNRGIKRATVAEGTEVLV